MICPLWRPSESDYWGKDLVKRGTANFWHLKLNGCHHGLVQPRLTDKSFEIHGYDLSAVKYFHYTSQAPAYPALSWVTSQPKSWRQHVSCSLASCSRQSQSVLHVPDIKQCQDQGSLCHFDSSHQWHVENQGWTPCYHKYLFMQHGKGLTKGTKKPLLFLFPAFSHRKTDSCQILLQNIWQRGVNLHL